MRRVLQGVFESSYSFSLENAKKHSIAHGIKTLEHLHGIPSFVVAFVTATGLSGHCVPLDRGALSALFLAGIISQAEYDSGKVLGLERLVSKKAGVEFGSLLHQFGVEVLSNLHGATVKKILSRVNPDVKDRFPKRGESLPAPKPPPAVGKQAQRAAEARKRPLKNIVLPVLRRQPALPEKRRCRRQALGRNARLTGSLSSTGSQDPSRLLSSQM